MIAGTSRRTPRRFLLDGVFGLEIAFDVFEDAMARKSGDASWYGLRVDGRVPPMTPLGRRLFGLHLIATTGKDTLTCPTR